MQYQTNYPYATTSQQYGSISHPREELRRRQQEYSQALAQQVAQREQQKRHEREMDHQYARNNTNFPTIEHTRHAAFEPTERGMLDGLGQNNYQNSRNNFARGQPQLHHRLPGGPESVNYPQVTGFAPTGVSYSGHALQQSSANFPPAYNQPPVDNQNFQSGFVNSVGSNQPQSVLQQSWQQQPLQDPSGLRPNTGWPPQKSLSQARTSQFWPSQTIAEQAAPPSDFGGYASPQRAAQPNSQSNFPVGDPNHNGGRRQRTDIHEGGRGDSGEAEKYRRKLQQQQEMQLALERQIEEKRQQKLEAKRRQEEEDRREMERFEENKRRQCAEEERLQEEKRRKAQIEQQKADQAAAAVAAANQQAKLRQQQKLHAQISQAQIQHTQQVQPFQQFPPQPQPQLQQPERFGNAPSPSKLKKPFTNSRAHLFEDPPPLQQSPQRGQMISNNHFGHSNQNLSPMLTGPQGFGQAFPQRTNAVGRSIDNTELRRQYDDMREELLRQKQIVDQLRQAQVQIQHQQQQLSPMRAKSGSIPTLMDLEELRNELRGELAYREQLHRQELESLKREKLHERSPVHSPHRYPGVKHSVDLLNRSDNRVQHHSATLNNQEVRAQPAFESRQPRQSPVKPVQHSQSIERLPRLPEKTLDASLVSLRGESRFVHFDGRVAAEPGKARNVVAAQSTIMDHGSDVLDEQSESVEVETTKVRKSLHRSPTKKHVAKKSATTMPSPQPLQRKVDFTNDRVDESHDFVVASASFSPLHKQNQHMISLPRAAASSHRYSQIPSVLSSRSPLKNSGKWRLESMGANDASDSDDELDASLDGEQLEALFQRNVRRHEILLGFQTKVQAQVQDSNQQDGEGTPHAKLAWAELRQQLEHNRLESTRAQQRRLSTTSTDSNDSTLGQQTAEDETALVASSQWMPSSLLLPNESNTRSRNK